MKFINLSRKNLTRPRLLTLFSLTSLMFSLAIFCQIGQAQQSQLSLADILVGLRSKKVTIDERNKLLSEAVKVRGITFVMTPEIETELGSNGAAKELVDIIRQKSEVIAAAALATDYTYYRKRADENNFKGQFDLAVTDYNKAIELNPKDDVSYLNRGRAYLSKKSFDLALTDLDKSIEINPKEAMAYSLRADLHEKKGNAAQAITDYQKAVELDAKNETAKTSLKRLQDEQARIIAKQKEEEQAKLLAKQKEEEQAKLLAKQKEEQQAKLLAAKQKTTPPAVVPNTPKAAGETGDSKTVELGSLVGQAVRMVSPAYPAAAKQLNIYGQVTVQITLDEAGDVISAKAVSGPQFLRASSEEAARKSKFKPALVDNQAVKASGFVVYNFTNKM